MNFSASGSASSDFDFITPNAMGKIAAAKFINGPDDPQNAGNDDQRNPDAR